MLIEIEDLEAYQSKEPCLLVHVDSAESFAAGHIEGAIHVAPSELVLGLPPAPGKLPSEEALRALFSRLGLQPETRVIAYDDEGGGWAGRLIWTLEIIGHQRWAYLNGGLQAWRGENRPLSRTEHISAPSPIERSVEIALHEQHRATSGDIMAQLGTDDFAIWDARSLEEHTGERAVSQRGGRIPGAIWMEWFDVMDRTRHLRLKDLDDLQAELIRRGLGPDKDIVTHCQSHHRSGLTYLVARLLNYPRIRAYDGSWSEWGNDAALPVESGPSTNTGVTTHHG